MPLLFLLTLLPLADADLDAASPHTWDGFDLPLSGDVMNEPLLQVRLPVAGSEDRMRSVPGGIRVQQSADRGTQDLTWRREGQATGLKLQAAADGDFRFAIDFDVKTLDPPKEGWAGGMVIRCEMADPAQPIISFGCIATPYLDRGMFANIKRKSEAESIYEPVASKFESGVWTVSRTVSAEGAEVTLVVTDRDGGELHRVGYPCTAARLHAVGLWFHRMPSGNEATDFTLHNISFHSPNLFPTDDSLVTPNTWLRPLLIGGTIVAILVGLYVQRRQA